ncbi:MAG TPA: hypothetical protein VN851_10270 [Thermoanaerobaculia bacterium]|nr:hypothetical protein [Thermoanaerobaculia bacterium]
MVEIRHLEVVFDVEGEGDAAVFARLFARHVEVWSRREEEKARQRRAAEARRRLGTEPGGGA